MSKKTAIETAIDKFKIDDGFYMLSSKTVIEILTNLIDIERDDIKEAYKTGYLHCRKGLDANSGAYMNETYPSETKIKS